MLMMVGFVKKVKPTLKYWMNDDENVYIGIRGCILIDKTIRL